MTEPRTPRLTSDLLVSADHGQIYVLSSGGVENEKADYEAENPFLAALDDAQDSLRFVGVVPGLLDILTPGQWNWETPIRVEVWDAEPDNDMADWDHGVDLDFDVPDGKLAFEAGGGSVGPTITTDIPPGRYRARVSGRGFTALGAAGAEGDDSYRLQLWPRTGETAPVLRKRWPGWDDYS